MHTEHLQNVRPVRVISGWLVAIAVTALLGFALEATGLMRDESHATAWWGLLALAVGFFAGGFFAGFRAMQAPILHAVAMAVTSLVAAWLLNLIVELAARVWVSAHYDMAYAIDVSGSLVTVMFVQLTAAVVGALLGYNVATRGRPGLGEHEPL